MSYRRDVLPLLGWIVGLVVGVALFHGLGSGPLEPPPLTDPSGWSDWAGQREPLVAIMALVRLLVLALAWYLVGATTIGLVARLARAARVVRITDALTIPWLRRFLQASLGLGLATAVVGAATVAPQQPVVTGPPAIVATSGSVGDESADRDEPTEPAGPVIDRDRRGRDLAAVGDPRGPGAVDTSLVGGAAPASVDLPRPGSGSAVDVASSASDRPPAEAQPVPLDLLMSPGGEEHPRTQDGADNGPPTPGGTTMQVEDVAGTDADISMTSGPDDVVGADGEDGRDDDVVGADGEDGRDDDADGENGEDDAGESAAEPDGEHLVVAGDSLWRMAHDVLEARWGRTPRDSEVAPYWREVIEVNRSRLADPDTPDLIFPGQRLLVPSAPTVPDAAAEAGS